MPHSTDQQQVEEDADYYKLLHAATTTGDIGFDINRPLELGEKAANAVDYEDIELSDDDLPVQAPQQSDLPEASLANDGEQDEDDPFSYLFDGGDGPSSDNVFGEANNVDVKLPDGVSRSPTQRRDGHATELSKAPGIQLPSLPQDKDISKTMAMDEVEESDPDVIAQMRLLREARKRYEKSQGNGDADDDVEPEPVIDRESLQAMWPGYNADERPHFVRLLPTKRAHYVEKAPLKPPKPAELIRVNLDLEADQERSFKLHTGTSRRTHNQADFESGSVVVTVQLAEDQTTDDDMDVDSISEEENTAGITTGDLRFLSEDWNDLSIGKPIDTDDSQGSFVDSGVEVGEEYDMPPSKKRKVEADGLFQEVPSYDAFWPSFDRPEELTTRWAKRAYLDPEDPHLLLDVEPPVPPTSRKRKMGNDVRKDVGGGITKFLSQRFNASNDEAYDLLKENHSSRVRSTLGEFRVEHSLPAQKLQWPFYKVSLTSREARRFHRPIIEFGPRGQGVRFNEPARARSKDWKGKPAQDVFRIAQDLSMGDNSHMILLEYSEEMPTMLSNFGMGNKLINYYRRKDAEDTARPKLEIGETQVLLPQDKSPFSIFGNVEPGNMMPTIHNGMFRAPVFKHDTKSTDFLLIRSHTGIQGDKWFLRPIENLHVVGQQFPSVEVPGTHSRKVTETAKRRLKQISFRTYRKHEAARARQPWLSNEMVKQHLPGSDIAQNRGKMREFMAYDKNTSSWVPKKGEVIPDEATMRNWIKPEDVCLLDAMQAGSQRLRDADINRAEDDREEDDEVEKEGETLEEQLAPWKTTKNFLAASKGQAMLELHGAGDPSGNGEAFSFVKTSMKGGFKPIGESIEEKLTAANKNKGSAHGYNVAQQQRAYEEAISSIWNRQIQSLSSAIEPSDPGQDLAMGDHEASARPGATPRSGYGTPSASFNRRGNDETASVISGISKQSTRGTFRITYKTRRFGREITRVHEISDEKVIRKYLKLRQEREMRKLLDNIDNFKPTGDKAQDEKMMKILQDEYDRLQRNKLRRVIREKQKGMHGGLDASNPDTPGGEGSVLGAVKATSTQRKCAACGGIGHIRTNKKLCPLLNGTGKVDNDFNTTAFAGSSQAQNVSDAGATSATAATPMAHPGA